MSEPGPWRTPPSGAPQQLPFPAGSPGPQQPGAPAAPGTAMATASPYWSHPELHTDTPRARMRRGRVTNVILVALLAVVAFATLTYFAVSLSVSVFLVCGALALIPLGICLFSLMWVDKWEPEPKSALFFAFCWGAGMSVATTLVIGSWVQPLLLAAGSASADPDVLGAVVQAPLVEEFCKGLGVLVLFFLRRRTFDGPIDGVVYAGTIAAGFAFTENILYFGSAMAQSDDAASGLVGIFLVRGLMSPFAHVMFTASLGACVGYAARHGGTALVLLAWVVGLLPAMLLHGLWNSTSLLGGNFFLAYGVLQVPIFIGYVVGIVFLRRSEAKLTRRRLADYVPSGWFSQQEVPMLATAAGRRRALRWAHSFGAGKGMRDFIHVSTRLAFTRQRILNAARHVSSRHARERLQTAQRQELALLHRSTAARAALLAQHGAATRLAPWHTPPTDPAPNTTRSQ